MNYEYEGKEYSVCVTLLPAQHCPGSVMFLLQNIRKNILYTGDFRISSCRFENYAILDNLTIHEVYLDSTFLTEEYTYFPTQVESVREICKVINHWLTAHSDNKVYIKAPAQYSLEFLLMNIAKKCNERVYVAEHQQAKYIYFPELDNVISHNEFNSRIFLESFDRSKKSELGKSSMILKPSALYWKNLKKGQPFLKTESKSKATRIAYSSHSSLEELKEFLRFLSPMKVILNVANPDTIKTLGQIWKPTCKTKDNDDIPDKLEQFHKRLNQMLHSGNDTKLLPKRVKL